MCLRMNQGILFSWIPCPYSLLSRVIILQTLRYRDMFAQRRCGIFKMELYGAPFTLAGKCQLMTSRDRGAWVTSPQILPMPHHHLRGIKQLLNLTLSFTRCVLNNVLIQICLNYIANHLVKLFFLTEDIIMKCYRHYTSHGLLRYFFNAFCHTKVTG